MSHATPLVVREAESYSDREVAISSKHVRLSQMQAVDARIERNKRELCDLLTEKNALLPIHSLPTEVFTMILDIVIYGARPQRPDFLLFVCRRWSTLTATTPSFWGTINSKWWRETNFLLTRSRNAHLSVKWDEWDTRFPSTLAYSAELERCRDLLLRTVVEQFHRIDYLCLDHVDPATYQSFQHSIPAVSDILHHVHIQRQDTRPPDTFPLTRAPFLHTLELDHIHPPDIALCDFPLLEKFSLCTLVWNPDLSAFLDFFSRTPRLKAVGLTIWDSDPTPTLQTSQRIIPLNALESFSCTSDNLTAPLLAILSRISAPRLQTVGYSLSGLYDVDVPLGDVFARFFPFSPATLQPLQLELEEDANTIKLLCFPLSAARVPLRWVRIMLDGLSEEDSDEENQRRSTFLFTLCQKTLSTDALEQLSCEMLIETPFWLRIFASSVSLTTMDIRLDAVSRFTAALLQAAREGNATFLPALSELEIRCVDGHMYTPLTWTGKLAQLVEALAARKALGQKPLDGLQIIRDAVNDLPNHRRGSKPPEVTKGWRGECLHVPKLYRLVGFLTIRPKDDLLNDSDGDSD